MKHPPPGLGHLPDDLRALEREGLLRTRPEPRPDGALSFCSNDYLGLSGEPGASGARGAGASRLVGGERQAHRDLERAVAQWLGLEEALAFSSGYAANVGLLSCLAGPGDLIVSDVLNHASIIDGARLSRARVVVVAHLDVAGVRRELEGRPERRAFVVTESYFSMDADAPDLAELRRACDEHHAALIVDEAHALGVLGPDGRGLCARAGVKADALVGTFGKAFGAGGAFVAGCPELVQWLWNRARSFVFSTGMSPVLARSALDGLRAAQSQPGRRASVEARAAELRGGLGRLGIEPAGFGHIVPWIVGDVARTLRIAAGLLDAGIHVLPIRPPSVPAGTSRLRMTVTARHREEDVALLLRAIERIRA